MKWSSSSSSWFFTRDLLYSSSSSQPQVPIHRASSSFWKVDFVSLQRMVYKVKVEQDKRQAQSSHRAHEEEAVETSSSSSSSSGNSSWKTIGSKYLLCWSNEQRNGQGGQEFVWKAGRGRGEGGGRTERDRGEALLTYRTHQPDRRRYSFNRRGRTSTLYSCLVSCLLKEPHTLIEK